MSNTSANVRAMLSKGTLLMLYRVGLALAAAAEQALREGYGWTPSRSKQPVATYDILENG